MAQIGIVYGSTSGNTAKCAEIMQHLLGKDRADLIDISKAGVDDLNRYPNLILGASTWGYGDLQDDWEGKMELLKKADLKEKTVALFGLGDADGYPSTFVDGMGEIYDSLVGCGVTPVGAWPTDSYSFDASTACRDNHFVGLALDEDNESDKTTGRIEAWLKQLESQWRN
jgi:flavodoxin I